MKRHVLTYILFFVLFSFGMQNMLGCGGDSGSGPSFSDNEVEPVPAFNPSETQSLAELAENTFLDHGVNVTVSPQFLDMNQGSKIERQSTKRREFTLSNNSGKSLSFNFRIFSATGGFSILDQNDNLIDGWSHVVLGSGESKTFIVKFDAWTFGTHTSFLSLSADEAEGSIKLPFRATVTGDGDFKVVTAGYSCSDESAPQVDVLDFYKVVSGNSRTHKIKICNNSGNAVTISQAQLLNDNLGFESTVMQENAYTDFLWSVSEEIDASFALGALPDFNGGFIAPNRIPFDGTITNQAGLFDVRVSHTGHVVEDLLIESGKYLVLDVTLSPDVDAEAPTGSLYENQSLTANLVLETANGPIQIPLVGATAGHEPQLQLSYRLDGMTAWQPVDLDGSSPAIIFGNVDLFLDWIAINSQIVELNIANTGNGSKNLEVSGENLSGFFEYYWDTPEERLAFPLSIPSGNAETIKLRYLPADTSASGDDFVAQYNFGQMYLNHNGGNGPRRKMVLVGEQTAGYAVELFYGGSELKREYNANEFKNLCLIRTSNAGSSDKTFTVINNNKLDDLVVNWSVEYDSSQLSVNTGSGQFTVPAGERSTDELKITLSGNPSASGQTASFTLVVDTSFSQTEAQGSNLPNAAPRHFRVPLRALISENGDSVLCDTGVLGQGGPTEVTFIMDRIMLTMAPPSLKESNRNHPAFKFHFPLTVDADKGTVLVEKPIEYTYDANDPSSNPVKQIRTYAHQFTNIRGCAPLATNPYRTEFEKGSWTGTGFECADDGNGTVTFRSPDSSPLGGEEFTFDTDTACMNNNGGEEYTDPATGTKWVVFYHDFFRIDGCAVQFYGRVSNFAYKPDEEKLTDVFERGDQSPNESESFYEDLYGAFRFDSYIIFGQDYQCGEKTYAAGTTINSPDEIKEFYSCIAQRGDSRRNDGFIDECSYFNFTIDAGEIPDDADSANPNTDNWNGFGYYEPYRDENGNIHPTKYDMTIYNVRMKAFVIGAGDRSSFFAHPGHLIYSQLEATLTTKRVAGETSLEDGTWQDLISVNSRQHFESDEIFIEHNNPVDTSQYWTGDRISPYLGNSTDVFSIPEDGVDYGGYGRGNYRYMSSDPNTIIPAGWPVNFDENNLMMLVGVGAFTGKGNTAPSFAKADAATGKGKPLYFTFHGCLVEGDPDENQGCYNYTRDGETLQNSTTPIIDIYSQLGVLPESYPVDPADCLLLEDPGFEDRDNYLYMSCINYKILPIDRDRLTNYYESNANRFEYEDNSYYNQSKCGFGM